MQCINCAACSNFAPQSFVRADGDHAHVVYQQPQTTEEMDEARAALAACPVAAIRLETKAERQHRAPSGESISWTEGDQELVDGMRIGGSAKDPPFPRAFLGDVEGVYWTGHHDERSFGATPYIVKATHRGKEVWVMVDTPRFTASSQRAVESLTGPSGPAYLFLTHVDDTEDHQKWADKYTGLQRIFHAGDLGRHNWRGDLTLEDVEILLPKSEKQQDGLTAYSLDGEDLGEDWVEANSDEMVILYTPGHSPGSITLYRRTDALNQKPGILFTGDTYAWTTRKGGRMTGMGQYGNDLRLQAGTLQSLLDLEWQVIAPGHGHPKDYRTMDSTKKDLRATQKEDLEVAIEDLVVRRL
jgi:glyoxylase-like metal-dependent hydrolase (beta-lactamase superfamily II)/ferredoxin